MELINKINKISLDCTKYFGCFLLGSSALIVSSFVDEDRYGHLSTEITDVQDKYKWIVSKCIYRISSYITFPMSLLSIIASYVNTSNHTLKIIKKGYFMSTFIVSTIVYSHMTCSAAFCICMDNKYNLINNPIYNISKNIFQVSLPSFCIFGTSYLLSNFFIKKN